MLIRSESLWTSLLDNSSMIMQCCQGKSPAPPRSTCRRRRLCSWGIHFNSFLLLHFFFYAAVAFEYHCNSIYCTVSIVPIIESAVMGTIESRSHPYHLRIINKTSIVCNANRVSWKLHVDRERAQDRRVSILYFTIVSSAPLNTAKSGGGNACATFFCTLRLPL